MAYILKHIFLKHIIILKYIFCSGNIFDKIVSLSFEKMCSLGEKLSKICITKLRNTEHRQVSSVQKFKHTE